MKFISDAVLQIVKEKIKELEDKIKTMTDDQPKPKK